MVWQKWGIWMAIASPGMKFCPTDIVPASIVVVFGLYLISAYARPPSVRIKLVNMPIIWHLYKRRIPHLLRV